MEENRYYAMLSVLTKQREYLVNCLTIFYDRPFDDLSAEELNYIAKIMKLSMRVTMEIKLCVFMIGKYSLLGIED